MTIEEFYKLLSTHDWFYSYSDDSRVFYKGESQSTKIINVLKCTPEFKKLYDDYYNHIWSGNISTQRPVKLPKPKLEDYIV